MDALLLFAVCLVVSGKQLRINWTLQPGPLCVTKNDLAELESNIMSKFALALAPIVQALGEASTQLEKAKGEILAAMADQEIPEDARAPLAALGSIAASLKQTSQSLDDLNPDAAPADGAAEQK